MQRATVTFHMLTEMDRDEFEQWANELCAEARMHLMQGEHVGVCDFDIENTPKRLPWNNGVNAET